jgi:hypothetical protein
MVDVVAVVIVALVVFAVVLTGALGIMLRAMDAQAEARQERLLDALARLSSTTPAHVATPPMLHGEPKREPRPLAVKLGAEVVELDPEIVARIEALTGQIQGGAPGVLEAALARGIATAEGGGDRDSPVAPLARPKLRLVQDESAREQGGEKAAPSRDDDDDNSGGGPSTA